MTQYKFQYPTIPASEEAFYNDICAVLKPHRLSKELWHRVMLVLSEAFTNAYLHGNQKDPGTNIIVAIKVNEREISVDIIDEGVGGGGSIDNINNRQPSTPSMEGGRGIDLIRHYADFVEFTADEKGGFKVSVKLMLERKEDIKT
ncbi:MAG: ATP-binding protein [Candidatus Zixiibacteriota bacterium]